MTRCILRVLCAVCTMSAGVAHAEPFDTIHPYVGVSLAYDENLLGLSNSAEAQQVLGSSYTGDWSHTEKVGLALDDQIGLQHLTADINTSQAQFERLTPLDYHASNATGNWGWSLGTHLTGDLGYTYAQVLAPYTFVHTLGANLRTQKVANFDAAWLFHPSWRVTASWLGTDTKYNLESEQADDRTEYRATTGLDYLQSNNSSTGIQLVQERGYFPYPQVYGPVAIINNYTQNEVDARIDWRFSGKTRLQFVGGWVERKHEILVDQNYRGVNARAIFDWAPTGKLTVNAQLWHEIGAVDDLTTVYSVNHGVSVAPSWAISEKLRFDVQYKVEERVFAQSQEIFNAPTDGVTYLFHNLNTMLTYDPTLHWQFQLSVYSLSQSTSDHSNDFSGKGIQCSTRYQF